MGFLAELLDKNYIDLASYLVGLIFDDFDKEDLDKMMAAAYEKNFPKEPIPIKDLDGFSLIELFHGKTLAFKDVGLSLLPQLIKKSIEKLDFKSDFSMVKLSVKILSYKKEEFVGSPFL